MAYLNHLSLLIKDFSILGYLIIALLAFFESFAFIGFIIPGSIAVIVGGFLAAQGALDVGDLFLFAALGAILGDNFSFYLGRKGTIAFRKENRFFKPAFLEKGEAFFKKHGEKSVFLGRFVGWMRPLIPFIAGLFKMERRIFLFWNILSGLLWAAIHIAVGYFFGGALQTIAVWSSRIGLFLVFLVLTLAGLWFIARKGEPAFRFLSSLFASIKNAVITNPDVERFVKSHPLVFRFIRGRLNRQSFSGLPLTLLGLAFVYVLFLFFGIIEDVITADAIVAADTRLANLLAAFRDDGLTKIFTWITLLGQWSIVVSSAIVFSVILWLWKKKAYLVPLWAALAGGETFALLGKLVLHRPRPATALYLENSFSFPSGHATIAMVFYGFLVYVIFRQTKKWRHKIKALLGGIGLISAIGLSRLYLGVHFLSDVWGGYLLGALWLLIGIALAEWLGQCCRPRPRLVLNLKIKLAAALLVFGQLVFYTGFALHYQPAFIPQEQPRAIVATDVLTVFQDKQIARFSETLLGRRQEPISFIVIAPNDQALIKAMDKAGWYRADPATFFSVAKLARAALANRNYPTAPMTPSFWNAAVHDFGFERPTASQSARQRHHARFWRTAIVTQDGGRVYVGTASRDTGVKWLVTHTISPDLDTERELLFTDLKNSGAVLKAAKKDFVPPTLGANFSGDQFFTDGKAYLIVLKK